ncbi:transposase [Streptomyces sp. NBC_01351]|uniref:transposase n=1 Tax=Streptomyces sp. NBC_01351 TaxID=2903833 RepID=UPI003FCD0243
MHILQAVYDSEAPPGLRKLPAVEILRQVCRVRYRKIRLVWADGGYTGRLVDWAKETLRLTLQIVKRTDDMSGFVVLPRRWVVERTLSWLMRSRRLARDHETRPESSEAAVLWSMTMGRRLARHRSRNVTRQPASA